MQVHDLESTPAYVTCICNHLTVFGGQYFVPPNKVDVFNFSLVWDLFRQPIVLIVVLCAWCIYIVLLLWARSKDKQHMTKVGVHNYAVYINVCMVEGLRYQ